MNTRVLFFVVSLIFVNCSVGLAQSLPESIDRPQYRIGDKWIVQHKYWAKELDWKAKTVVTAIEKDRISIKETFLDHKSSSEVGKSRQMYWKSALPRLSDVWTSASHSTLETRTLEFPLSIGKTWSQDVSVTRKSGVNEGTSRYTGESKVIGWAKYRIAEREYDVLKVVFSGGWTRLSWRGSVQHEVLYAPQIRAIVRREYKSYSPEHSLYWWQTAEVVAVDVRDGNISQAAPEHVQKEIEDRLSGSWLVTVGSDVKTRTLRVKSVTAASDNTFFAEAQYGYTCGKFNAVLVEGRFSGGQLSLDFFTPANSQISVKEEQTTGLSDSFVSTSGEKQAVSLVKYDPASEKTWCDTAKTSKK